MSRFYYLLRTCYFFALAFAPAFFGSVMLVGVRDDRPVEDRFLINGAITTLLVVLPLCILCVRELARFVSPPEARDGVVVLAGAPDGGSVGDVLLRGTFGAVMIVFGQLVSVALLPVLGVPIAVAGWMLGFGSPRTTYLRGAGLVVREGYLVPSRARVEDVRFVSVKLYVGNGTEYEPVLMRGDATLVPVGERTPDGLRAMREAMRAAAVLGKNYQVNPQMARGSVYAPAMYGR